MKHTSTTPLLFTIVAGVGLLLGGYLIATRTSFHSQVFARCAEVVNDITSYTYVNSSGLLSFLILLVSGIGILLASIRVVKFVVSYIRLSMQAQLIEVLYENVMWVMKKHDMSKNSIKIIDNQELTAYTIGLINPCIVISTALVQKMSRKQLEAVILHELYHVRNRHVLWLLTSRTISALLFFIPLVGLLAQRLKIQFELSADEFVIKKQKTKIHLRHSLALNLQYVGGVIPHFATSPIEKRIKVLMSEKIPHDRIGTGRFVVSILSLFLMTGIAVTEPGTISAAVGADTDAVCQAEEDCKAVNCFTPLIPASHLR